MDFRCCVTWPGSATPAGRVIYGAVQNLILAARAYGIGTTLTTLYSWHEDDVRDLLGLPEDALTMGLLPLGYPARGAGRNRNAGRCRTWCTGTGGA